jgi:tetratricopeptide (TPR) repeat protein
MFKCKTPTCAISKADFRADMAMPCPVCQTMLTAESILNEEHLELLQNLPYVIAYPLQKTLEEKHAWTKINLFKDTFLNYLKYLGLLTASEFFNSPFKDKRMVALFQQSLAEPSFGTWNQYIRETLAFLKEKEHSFFIPELPEYYEKVQTGKKRKLYKGEIEFIDGNGDVQIKKQEATAIEMLINFRNRYLGHGLTLDAATAEKRWEEYSPIFFEILRELKFTVDYKMYKYENDETFLLQSAQIVQKENNRKSNQVWLESPTGEVMDILPFYVVPGELTIRKEDKEQILAYESYTGKSIKFFSPEGTEKQTSGRILEKLNLLLRDKQKEKAFSSEEFTKEIFLSRVAEENKLILDTLIAEKKVIPGVYVHREDMEIKLRSWIGARANIFVIAAEAGSGKTNLLVEMQKQYSERELPTLLIRAGRMEKKTLREQLAYLLNLEPEKNFFDYKNIAGTQAAPTILLIDGLNEAKESESIWKEILNLCKEFSGGRLKFIITSRANSKADFNRYTIKKDESQLIYGANDHQEFELSANVHWLTALNMVEMKSAWENYSLKEINKYKPLFLFDDLATFDREIYNQISNPLVMRLFLEIYHNKSLPKKGNKHLNVWEDWLATFQEDEREFFRLIANAIWEKGENELLLDNLLADETLKPFLTDDRINSAYQRLKNNGWISRYVNDLNLCLAITVEGALYFLIGEILYYRSHKLTIDEIKTIKIQKKLYSSGLQSYLTKLVLQNDLLLITELIDNEIIDSKFCIPPLIISLKTYGSDNLLTSLLSDFTQNDWHILEDIIESAKELQLFSEIKNLAIGICKYSSNKNIDTPLFLASLIHPFLDEPLSSRIMDTILEKVKIISNRKTRKIKDIALFLSQSNYANESLKLYEILFPNTDNLNSTELNFIATALDSANRETEAREFYEKALNKNKLENKQESLTRANLLYNLAKFQNEYTDSLKMYQQALEIEILNYGEIHETPATSLVAISNLQIKNGFLLDAHQNLSKAKSIFEKIKLESAYLNKIIGYYHIENNELNQALQYLLKAKLLSPSDDQAFISKSLIHIYTTIGELELSFQICKEYDLSLENINSDFDHYLFIKSSIGYYHLFETNNYKLAIEYFNQSSEIYNSIKNKTEHLNSQMSFITYFNSQSYYFNGDYQLALKGFISLEDSDINVITNDYYIEYTEYLANTHYYTRDYKNAINEYMKLINLTNEKTKKIEFIELSAQCYIFLDEKQKALDYLTKSAEIRKNDPDFGIEAEATQESIKACIRLSKELGKEDEIPEWIKDKY